MNRKGYKPPTRLSTESVAVHFGGLAALNDAEIWVEKGEVVGLIGPNGAGKSTLINVISGFQVPTTGKVSLDSEDVTGSHPDSLARMGLARTFQGVRVFRDLSVHENVALGALSVGFSAHEASSKANSLLNLFGLERMADRLGKTMPGGMQRMLGVARALAGQPGILLLDEPGAGLNEEESTELKRVIREAIEQLHVGIILIEHDMALIMEVCDRIHVLDHGRMIAHGTPQEVQKSAAVISAYLGSSGDEESE